MATVWGGFFLSHITMFEYFYFTLVVLFLYIVSLGFYGVCVNVCVFMYMTQDFL